MLQIQHELKIIDSILDAHKIDLGKDYNAYKNHCYRVYHFALELHCMDEKERECLAIACAFHDLGIWTHHTFDYLSPSQELAQKYLVQNKQSPWQEIILAMIENHHKITSITSPQDSLAEIFRQADWIDVTLGIRKFTIKKTCIKEIRKAFPNAGFHNCLLKLSLKRLFSHPLRPLPMMRW